MGALFAGFLRSLATLVDGSDKRQAEAEAARKIAEAEATQANMAEQIRWCAEINQRLAEAARLDRLHRPIL